MYFDHQSIEVLDFSTTLGRNNYDDDGNDVVCVSSFKVTGIRKFVKKMVSLIISMMMVHLSYSFILNLFLNSSAILLPSKARVILEFLYGCINSCISQLN